MAATMGSLTVAVTNLRNSRTLATSTVVAFETYRTSLFRICNVVARKYADGSRILTLYIIGMIGPSNREQSPPNCSATARVSPRYKKTDAGLRALVTNRLLLRRLQREIFARHQSCSAPGYRQGRQRRQMPQTSAARGTNILCRWGARRPCWKAHRQAPRTAPFHADLGVQASPNYRILGSLALPPA